MVYLILAMTLVFYSGCSNQDQEVAPPQTQQTKPSNLLPTSTSTAYGDSELILTYLGQINPYIQEVGKIQLEVDKVVGSTQKATGANLAKAMEKYKPRLEAAQTEFSKIQPPPLLAGFHSNIENLIALRLDAYNTTIRGSVIEKKTGDEKVYEEAEQKLKKANELIASLNSEMAKINNALKMASTPAQTASP